MATETEPAPGALAVEVVWVEAGGTIGRCALVLAAGARVADALEALRARPVAAPALERLARGELQAAIYGERCAAATSLHPGDRIELLAPLEAEPKAARRRRVEQRRALDPRNRWRRG